MADQSDRASTAARERLELADWRRRITDLYVSVRAEAASDPARAWRHWRDAREELFRSHPQSPLPAAARRDFVARHWPYDANLRFEVVVDPGPAPVEIAAMTTFGLGEPMPGGLTLALPVSSGGQEDFTRIGRVEVPFHVGVRSLGVYWMAGYAGGLFVPFRDATNGRETYGAGRYLLDAAKSADLGPGVAPDSLVLDFNFSFHPSCAFDPRWSCPLAPPENRLDIPVMAGERLA
ncbi:MAG TPA: DUF1684 domain-containing protein [Candidatus Limnocylindria bacterium]|nr:DUF1684 domain-containing protein [Candidatus Limnocylindria bacterium]